jgi:hypothetical protein
MKDTDTPPHIKARRTSLITGIASLALLVLSPVLAALRIQSGTVAFFTWIGGVPALAIASSVAMRLAKAKAPLETPIVVARHERVIAIAMRIVLAVGATLAVVAVTRPPINDVATTWNEDEVPQFPVSRRIGMPSDAMREWQARVHPDVRTAISPHDPSQTFQNIERFAAQEGWRTAGTGADESTCFTVESPLWGFIDDIAVKMWVNPATPAVTYIDIRSRSRAGRSDHGANAARIIKLIGWLEQP